jgi:predicted MFS family arabinose efflux permease
VRGLLGRPGFRRLLFGQAASGIGDWTATIAMLVLVLQLSGSAAAVGGILVLRLLPAAVAGPLAARAAAQRDRRSIMLSMDLVRVPIVLLLPLLPHLWWVYLWAVVLEVAGLVFLPARDAAVPELVGEEADLGLANGLVLGSSYAGIPIGALIFGGLAWLTDTAGINGIAAFWPVFGFDAATFLVSYAMLRGIRELPPRGRAELEAGSRTSFHDALRIPLVRVVLPVTVAVSIGIGALFSNGVAFVTDVLRAGRAEFGVLIGLFAGGALVGLWLQRVWGAGQRMWQVKAGVAGQGAVIAGMGLTGSLLLAFLAAAGYGMFATLTLVAGISLLQERLSGLERDLGLAAFHVVVRGGLAASALLTGLAADLLGRMPLPVLGTVAPQRMVLLAAGAILLVAAPFIVDPASGRERDLIARGEEATCP